MYEDAYQFTSEIDNKQRFSNYNEEGHRGPHMQNKTSFTFVL